MRRNNNNGNPKAVPPDLLPESDACRLAYRLQSKDNEGEDKRRAKKDKPKTIIEGPVRRWTPKRALCCAGWIFCCPIYSRVGHCVSLMWMRRISETTIVTPASHDEITQPRPPVCTADCYYIQELP